MKFRDWKAYWKTMNWTGKWFAIFLLIRPIADNFYFLKNYTTFFSPVYIIGVLTPLLACMSMMSNKLKRRVPSQADHFMGIFGMLVIVNCLVFVMFMFSIDNLGNAIKYVTTPILFFYLRRQVQSKTDLHFILTCFLYSSIFPFLMFIYESIFSPIELEYVSEGRGGGTRLRGSFGDSMNYAIHFVGTFLIMAYFFLENIFTKKQMSKSFMFKLIGIFVLCLAGVISIRHVSTWSVFLMTVGVFLFFNARNVKGYAFIFFVCLIVLPFFARSIYEKQIYPLIAKEFNVLSGETGVEFAMNGRVSRWERYFDIWDRMPEVARFLGTPFSGFREVPVMIGGGMHNDLVRYLFMVGIIGTFSYIIFYVVLFMRRKLFRIPERFLLLCSIGAIFLYSLTTLPSMYLGLMNYILPIFCFALLPRRKAYELPPPERKAFLRPAVSGKVL